jgi:hypothetical protein
MTLSSDNVKTIRQYADKLEKWAENLSYSTSPAENLWSVLTLSLYPQDLQGVMSWLANISPTGRKAGKELEEFSKLVQEIDAWRNQGVYPEDLGDFCAQINRLMKVTRNVVSILRTLSDSDESKTPEIKVVTEEKPNISEVQETNAASIKSACTPGKSLPKEVLMAYKLRYEKGLNIRQIAKKMTAELKRDKALRPWQISRWIKQAENLHKCARIPIRSIASKTSGTAERIARINTAAQDGAKKT